MPVMEGPQLKLELSCVRRALAATVLIAPPWILSIASLSRTAIDLTMTAERLFRPSEFGVSVGDSSTVTPLHGMNACLFQRFVQRTKRKGELAHLLITETRC